MTSASTHRSLIPETFDTALFVSRFLIAVGAIWMIWDTVQPLFFSTYGVNYGFFILFILAFFVEQRSPAARTILIIFCAFGFVTAILNAIHLLRFGPEPEMKIFNRMFDHPSAMLATLQYLFDGIVNGVPLFVLSSDAARHQFAAPLLKS